MRAPSQAQESPREPRNAAADFLTLAIGLFNFIYFALISWGQFWTNLTGAFRVPPDRYHTLLMEYYGYSFLPMSLIFFLSLKWDDRPRWDLQLAYLGYQLAVNFLIWRNKLVIGLEEYWKPIGVNLILCTLVFANLFYTLQDYDDQQGTDYELVQEPTPELPAHHRNTIKQD